MGGGAGRVGWGAFICASYSLRFFLLLKLSPCSSSHLEVNKILNIHIAEACEADRASAICPLVSRSERPEGPGDARLCYADEFAA